MEIPLFDVNYKSFGGDLSPLLKSYARSVPDELGEPASLHRPLFSPIEIPDEGSNGERRKPEPEPEKEHLASDEPSDEPSDKEEESEESGKIGRIKKGDEGVLISAQELIEADLDPLDFAVPGLFPKGVSLLAGPPKSGKSLLALNIALAVARGGRALGEIPVQQGNALVMSLEDGARRTGERIKKMGAEHDENAILEARERLNLTFHWRKFGADEEEEKEGKGLLQLVLGALQQIGEDYRLIVVDTLQRLRRQANVGSNLYVEDYKAMQDFQQIARELDAAVLLLHHTNKLTDAEDPYLKVSGSTGLTAQADTVGVLEGDRIESEARLQVSGRDISGHDLGLRLDTDTLNWQLVGSGHALGMGDVRRKIYDVLKEADGPLSPSDVDDQTEVDYARVKTELGRMVDAKQITKVGRGEYTVRVQKGLFSGQD